MSKILAYHWGGGKTYAARLFHYATVRDVIISCALFGGYESSMGNCKPEDVADNYRPKADKYISCIYKKNPRSLLDIDKELFDYLKVELNKIKYALFDKGSYISSQKADVFNFSADYVKVTFLDKDWNFSNNIYKNNEHIAILFYDKIAKKAQILIKWEFLAEMDGVEFDGVPYIRVIESAVNAPNSFVYPSYSKTFGEMTLDGKLRSCISSSIASIIQSVIAGSDVKDLQVSKGGITWYLENCKGDKNYKTVTNFVSYLASNVENQVNEQNKTLISPTNVEVYDDKVFFESWDGNTVFKPIPVLSLLFKTSRCFIDSISNLVYTANGNGLSGGLSGGFLKGLQNATEFESILFYSTLMNAKNKRDIKDPLANYDLGGFVDGFIYTEGTEGSFLSDVNWYVTSRNYEAQDRDTLYLFINVKDHLVYGNRTVYNYIEKRIYTYESLNLKGRFDDKLKKEPNIEVNVLSVNEGSGAIKSVNNNGQRIVNNSPSIVIRRGEYYK